MSKKEEKRMRERLQQDRTSAEQRYGAITQQQAPERAQSREQYQQRYNELLPQYQNFAETGGLDPTQQERLRKGYQGFSETGGFDPNTASSLKSFYGGMLNTGGYSAQDISNIRGRSNAAIPSVYARLKENLANRMRLSGGYSPSYNATLAKLGRQSAQDIATTARDTEVDIADRLRQGKLTGAAGEFGLENAIRSGKLLGLQGGQGLEESIRQGKVYGQQGLAGLGSSDLAQMNQYDLERMQAENAITGARQGTYSPDLALSTRPGVGSNILKGLEVGANFAAPFLTGGFNPFSMFKGGGTPGGNVPISSTGLSAYGIGPSTADWLYAQPQY